MKLGRAIPHNISIEPSCNMGFFVKIGCGVFTASSKDELISGLDSYLTNPAKWEKEYAKECAGEETVEEQRRPGQPNIEQPDLAAAGAIGTRPAPPRHPGTTR